MGQAPRSGLPAPQWYTAYMSVPAPQQVLDRVADALSDRPEVKLAIAFGSVAGGTTDATSDFDLAILGDRGLDASGRAELIRLVAGIAGRPVDLVDLRTAGVPVLRSALCYGQRLVCKDRRAYEQLLSRLLVDTEDFLPYRERMLRERRRAWIG